MKNLMIIGLCLLSTLIMHGQVTNIDIISSKTYENQKSTNYYNISGFIPAYLIENLSVHIESHPDVEKFSFYDNNNLRKCMCTASCNFNEEILIDLINDFLSQFYDFNINYDFLNTEYFEYNKSVKFIINGINSNEHKESIINQISQNQEVISIEIKDNNICKITINKTTTKQNISEIFDFYDLEIVEIHNH